MPKGSLAAAAAEKRHVSLMIGDASDTVEHHALLRAPEYQAGQGTSAGKDAGAAPPKLTGWQRVAGLALMAGSACTFSTVTLMVSLLAPDFPMYEIVAIRFVSQWLCAVASMAYLRKSLAVPRYLWFGMTVRCVFGVASMLAFYLSLEHLAMANASVIRFTSPAIVLILACLIFKEEFGVVSAVSTLLSLAGVVLVAQPHFLFGDQHVATSSDEKGGGSGTPKQQIIAAMFALLASVSAALAFLAIRKVNPIHPFVTTFWYSLSGVVMLAPLAIAVGGMRLPTTVFETLLICGTGVVGWLGQWFMCRSLQLEEAGPATMMRYLDVAFAYIFQIFIEHRPVDLLSPLGAGLVVSGAAVVTLQRWYCPKRPKNTGPLVKARDPVTSWASDRTTGGTGATLGHPLLSRSGSAEFSTRSLQMLQ